MEDQKQTHAAAHNDDKREIFSQLHEHSVAIASLQSGVEGLASSTESGFRNIQTQIENLGNSIRAQRPQFGVIASILVAAAALIISLAGFALKSAVLPLERDIAAHQKLTERLDTINERRIEALESLAHNYLIKSGELEARIVGNEDIIKEFNRLMLENYVSGSVGAARAIHQHPETETP